VHCSVTDYRDATVDAKFHRVGRRLGFRFAASSASSFSLRTGLAGTTTLHPFVLPRFWSCYRPPRGFPLEVRPFALKGNRFQPFPAMQEFNSPLDGALIRVLPLSEYILKFHYATKLGQSQVVAG